MDYGEMVDALRKMVDQIVMKMKPKKNNTNATRNRGPGLEMIK
jgi:hypothetical protein